MRKGLIFLGLVVGAAGAGQALAQTAGVIQFAAGAVKVVAPGGAEREARKGVAVNVGDTLTTPAGGLAQLKMGDGAIVVVQPESRLTVAEFHYAGVEDGNEKVRYRLEHGGFRAVTGAIGRTHKKNYLIETPIAHMGVRGTDHESYYFPATGPVSGDGVKPGAFNKVNTGRTYLRTQAGEVEIEPNQVGFVASAGEVPTILPSVPEFFNRSIAPRNAGRSPKHIPDAAELALVERAPDESLANEVRLLRTRGPRVTPGSGEGPLVAFSKQVGKDGGFGESGNGVTVEVHDAQSTTGSFGTAINWTTWSGGEVKVGGVKTAGATQVISTTDKTDLLAALPALPVSATYSYSGVGPAPTNQAGTSGVINSLNVGVSFSTQKITSYDLNATAGGTTWNSSLNTTAPHSITNFTDAGGIRLTGTCTTCGGTTAGTAHGTFVGSQAENLITTFGLSGSASQSLNGAAVLSRPLP
ncbi:MAG TPA: FecR domain-containing protein [Burkholderiales bacterium]|nr:FecR domain-containing protein [Burkholderiales bacterium]